MDGVKCKYCFEPARYFCTCTTPNIIFCKVHLEVHENLIGDHKISTYKNLIGDHKISTYKNESLKVNLQTKKTLIRKIFQVKRETREKTEEILADFSEKIIKLQKNIDLTVEKLNNFMKTCDQVVQAICSIDAIPINKINSPLESILVSDDISELMFEITPPVITYSDGFYLYTPSTFPLSLYNYADLRIDFFRYPLTINIHPQHKDISNKRLDSSSRFLNIGKGRLLITGGKEINGFLTTQCFVLNVITEEITEYPPLTIGRHWHSMAWIEGNPAVIGGASMKKSLKKSISSVEVLKSGEWIEVSPINIPRDSHASVTISQGVWTMGGLFDNELLDSIEKYENNLLLLGGRVANDIPSDKVIYINTETLSIARLTPLDSPVRFPHSSFFVESGLISCIGLDATFNNQLATYSIRDVAL